MKPLIALILLFSAPVAAQPLRPDAALSAWQRNHLQELVHLQTATESALAGEVLWFAVRTAEGISAQPLDFSRIAYVELLHPSGAVALSTSVPLSGGSGSGSFLLTPDLSSGRYRLRAYTQWQRNFDTARFFSRELLLINPLRSEGVLQAPQGTLKLHLTAEGGSLVAGIPARLQAELEGGGSGTWQGVLLRGENDTVQRFTLGGNSLTSFTLIPAAGSVYRAVAFGPEGALVQAGAPSVQPDGFVLQATPSPAGYSVEVRGTGEQAYLMAHHRGRPLFYRPVHLSGGAHSFTLPAAELPEGLCVLTLFTPKGQPVAERLLFSPYKGPENPLPPQTTAAKRAPVTLEAPEGAGHLTVTVKRKSVLEQGGESLPAYLLLQALIDRPLPGADSLLQQREALDLRLRTRRWAGFSWADVLSDTALQLTRLPELERWGVQFRRDTLASGSGQASTVGLLAATLSGPQAAEAADRSLGMQVQQAFYGARLDSMAVALQDSLPFYGRPYRSYPLDDFTRFPTMEEVFREFIPEVIVRREGGGFARVRMISVKEERFFEEPPLILLDNKILDEASVLKVDPLRIRKIDVFPLHYITGSRQHSGLMALHSYDGRLPRPAGSDSLARSVSAASTLTYRPFFSPDHSVPDPRPDFRYLLYWQAPVPGGGGPLRFYTSDIPGTYEVIMEGWREGRAFVMRRTLLVD